MKKSIMDIKKEEQQRDFLKLSPIERLRTMHNLFLQFVALKAKSEGVSEHEIYTRYLRDNPRHYERGFRKLSMPEDPKTRSRKCRRSICKKTAAAALTMQW